jgi:hypothetical protein
MTWEAIAAIGQILAAVGVIVTLLYLAMQIRDGARATDSQALVNLSAEMESVMLAAAQDDAIIEAVLAAQRGDDLTEAQNLKLALWFGAYLRVTESHILQKQLNATQTRLEEPIANLLRGFAQTEFFRDQMARSVTGKMASPEFLSWLDDEVLTPTADEPEA